MARQLHGHSLGYTRSNEIPDSRAAEIVRNPTRASGGNPSFPPRFVELGFAEPLAGHLGS
jgi:hypothetical protein